MSSTDDFPVSTGTSTGASWSTRRFVRAATTGNISEVGDTTPDLLLACRARVGGRTVVDMTPLRARVQNGKLHLDEPTELPDGTELDLVVDDEGDDLTEEERHALHGALSRSWESAKAEQLQPAKAIIEALRNKR
jgi:hypothetical protein